MKLELQYAVLEETGGTSHRNNAVLLRIIQLWKQLQKTTELHGVFNSSRIRAFLKRGWHIDISYHRGTKVICQYKKGRDKRYFHYEDVSTSIPFIQGPMGKIGYKAA